MKARITLITLGVDDLQRSVGFYQTDLAADQWMVGAGLNTARSRSSTCRPA